MKGKDKKGSKKRQAPARIKATPIKALVKPPKRRENPPAKSVTPAKAAAKPARQAKKPARISKSGAGLRGQSGARNLAQKQAQSKASTKRQAHSVADKG